MHDADDERIRALTDAVGPAAAAGLAEGRGLLQRVGAACWSVVGIVVILVILTAALATVSEVVLPLVFGVVLAVLFAPLCRAIQRHGWRPALASMAVVVGLIVVSAGAVLMAVTAVVEQAGEWSGHVDRAVAESAPGTEAVGIDEEDLDTARSAVAGLSAFIAQGFVTEILSGVGTLVGFLAGAVLAVLILYYLLKDGPAVRQRVVTVFPPRAQDEVDALVTRSAATIRAYGAARSVLSAAVAVLLTVWSAVLGLPMLATIFVVNFLGGYIPYIGAIVGGAVAVVLALSELGVGAAVATIVVALLANLALENFVEPQVMGRRLDIHPLTVLIVTTAGGIVGGIVGLILAVPLTVVAVDAVATYRRHAWRQMGIGDDQADA